MDNLIYTTLKEYRFPDQLSKLIVAQAKHESANYTSKVFKENNNLFGYKFVGQSLASKGTKAPANEGDYYAKYKSVKDSVLELIKWIQRRQKENKFPADLSTITTPGQYAQLLKQSGYYGDKVTTYTNALTKWLKTVSVTAAGASAGLIIGIVSFFLLKKIL